MFTIGYALKKIFLSCVLFLSNLYKGERFHLVFILEEGQQK